jgi:hypothetical protein
MMKGRRRENSEAMGVWQILMTDILGPGHWSTTQYLVRDVVAHLLLSKACAIQNLARNDPIWNQTWSSDHKNWKLLCPMARYCAVLPSDAVLLNINGKRDTL